MEYPIIVKEVNMDRELERIYGWSSDPNEGRWFVSDNHNYVRYINGYRETVHKNSNDKWVVSVGGPNNKFQVGVEEFDNTTQAKKWADNRDMESLHHLEMLIDSWR